MEKPYKLLQKRLGYRFKKKERLEQALTHRSFRFEEPGVDHDNQRLEFLGDAVLGFVTAAYAYEHYKDQEEGVLTAIRSRITSGEALTRMARTLDLGACLRMGRGERLSGGHERASNLADALEAILGAAYLDGGVKAVRKIFTALFAPELEGLRGGVWAGNPKGQLQELSQRRWQTGPSYRLLRSEGPPHAVIFTMEVTLGDGSTAIGTGRSKQDAQRQAAARILETLGEH